MNDTVPTPDEAEIIRRIRLILSRPYNDEYAIQQIRELVTSKPPSTPSEAEGAAQTTPPDQPVRWADTGSGGGWIDPAPTDDPHDPRGD